MRDLKALDLSRDFDLEYSHLLEVHWRKEIGEIELKFRCSVNGWWLKEKRNRFVRALGLSDAILHPCLEYLVEIVFLGVTNVIENLSEARPRMMAAAASDPTGANSIMFDIDNVSVVELKKEVFRFYLRAEELELDFNFVDCIYRELCTRE